MSKICIFSDVHWSKNTGIVRSRGDIYSTRLELLIKSMNWVNELAVSQNCDSMFCLGDMMDRSTLDDEEISALRAIKWNKLKTFYIVGNHESSVSSLNFSTVGIFRNKRVKIISKPEYIVDGRCDIVCLPYITEDNRKTLKEYLKEFPIDRKLVVFSHNDIKGIRYGAFESKTGFEVEDIKANCNLFLNGHLHNSEWIVKDRILNVGSLSAHNFTNDSYRYRYGAWILDTDTLSMTFFENPYSLNFYKVVIDDEKDLSKLIDLKPNAVVSVKCKESLTEEVRKYLSNADIVASKLSFIYDSNIINESIIKDINVSDHLVKFRDFILSRDDIENIDIFKEELMEVCK